MAFSLPATKREVHTRLNQLSRILDDMPATALSRYALSEIVLIRACSIFEFALANMASKIACAGPFENGKTDAVILRCRSLEHARQSMLSEGGVRVPPKSNLKWTRASYINESVTGVIEPASHFVSRCRAYGSQIAEIFEVRNHAAHKNSSSRKKYLKWVKAQYGHERNLQVGYFLLTVNLSPTPNIKRYIRTIGIIVDDIVAGP